MSKVGEGKIEGGILIMDQINIKLNNQLIILSKTLIKLKVTT